MGTHFNPTIHTGSLASAKSCNHFIAVLRTDMEDGDFFPNNLWFFQNNSYLCTVAQLAQQWEVGGLTYEKDVFALERKFACMSKSVCHVGT